MCEVHEVCEVLQCFSPGPQVSSASSSAYSHNRASAFSPSNHGMYNTVRVMCVKSVKCVNVYEAVEVCEVRNVYDVCAVHEVHEVCEVYDVCEVCEE